MINKIDKPLARPIKKKQKTQIINLSIDRESISTEPNIFKR